jgi:hypothetical protein
MNTHYNKKYGVRSVYPVSDKDIELSRFIEDCLCGIVFVATIIMPIKHFIKG